MIVSASKVSALCTGPEIALIMASRPPELNQLAPFQLKRLIARARKLSDKWQDRGRSQARAKSRKFGSGSAPARLTVKTQVFADALKSLEARLARLEESPAPATAKPKLKTKRIRQAGHRATRAKIRKGLAGHKTSH